MNFLSIASYLVLILVLILSIILFYKLYLKIKSSDKSNFNLIEFPKETSSKIENFINESKKNNEELIKYLNSQYKDAKSIIKDVDEKIAPFEKVAREKNDELKEYKRGYEYSRNKSILDGIIDTIVFIENAEKKIQLNDDITKSYFQSTKDKLLIVLNNSGIEIFTPKLNINSIDHHGCEVDAITEPTKDKEKNNLVHSIISNGYMTKLKNDEIFYLKKALVKIYEFNNDINKGAN